jgi:UDP-glucose 4-epimerase
MVSVNTNKKKKVLVTGAGGALAQKVIKRLKKQHDIVAVDFRQAAKIDKDIPSYKLDFCKRGFEDIFREHTFDAVLHLGRLMVTESDRVGRYNANVTGTQNLLNLSLKYNVREVIILSTFFVYGAHEYNPALLEETAPLKASGLTLNLVDSVELENLSNIYLLKYPELGITILRPCRVVGPGVRNSTSLLLSRKISPVLAGFSPMMQFLHVDDMADAIVLAFKKNKPGIYNIAPEDWIPYQDTLKRCGCILLPLPSIPSILPATLSRILGWKSFPSYLINYFKYSVIIDGGLFKKTFGFRPKRNLHDIFEYYLDRKKSRKLK